MNTDLITRIATAAIRIGVQLVTAGRHRDAEALAVQLESMDPARKADVDGIERDALERLAGFDPVDPDTLGTLHRLRRPIAPVLTADELARVGGPLDGGD